MAKHLLHGNTVFQIEDSSGIVGYGLEFTIAGERQQRWFLDPTAGPPEETTNWKKTAKADWRAQTTRDLFWAKVKTEWSGGCVWHYVKVNLKERPGPPHNRVLPADLSSWAPAQPLPAPNSATQADVGTHPVSYHNGTDQVLCGWLLVASEKAGITREYWLLDSNYPQGDTMETRLEYDRMLEKRIANLVNRNGLTGVDTVVSAHLCYYNKQQQSELDRDNNH